MIEKERMLKAAERVFNAKGYDNIQTYIMDGVVTYDDDKGDKHICIVREGWDKEYITPDKADHLCFIVSGDLDTEGPEFNIMFDIFGLKVLSDHRAMVKHCISVPVKNNEEDN